MSPPLLTQKLGHVRAGVDGPVLLHDRLPCAGSTAVDLGVQLETRLLRVEDRSADTHRVLHDHDGESLVIGDIDRRRDLRQGLGVRRVLDLQRAAEVLLLDVDDDKGATRRGHGVLLC